jgi:hypothetical protein
LREDLVELGRDGSFVVKLKIPMKGLCVEAAPRHAEAMGELVGCLEHGVRNGDGGLHTASIPLVVVR